MYIEKIYRILHYTTIQIYSKKRMKVTQHIQNANGKALFSFELLPPLKGQNIQCIFNTIDRSEEHTSELQSRPHLVCRLLLEKKKKKKNKTSKINTCMTHIH